MVITFAETDVARGQVDPSKDPFGMPERRSQPTGERRPPSNACLDRSKQEGGEDIDLKQSAAQLGSPVVAERGSAMQSLIAAGPRAMPTVRAALGSDDREVRLRAETIAEVLEAEAAKYLKSRGASLSMFVMGATGRARGARWLGGAAPVQCL
jgi:hypothetical protein